MSICRACGIPTGIEGELVETRAALKRALDAKSSAQEAIKLLRLMYRSEKFGAESKRMISNLVGVFLLQLDRPSIFISPQLDETSHKNSQNC